MTRILVVGADADVLAQLRAACPSDEFTIIGPDDLTPEERARWPAEQRVDIAPQLAIPVRREERSYPRLGSIARAAPGRERGAQWKRERRSRR